MAKERKTELWNKFEKGISTEKEDKELYEIWNKNLARCEGYYFLTFKQFSSCKGNYGVDKPYSESTQGKLMALVDKNYYREGHVRELGEKFHKGTSTEEEDKALWYTRASDRGIVGPFDEFLEVKGSGK